MIKLQVIGNLGKDATKNEVGGKTVINFSVAHTESYADKNGEKQSKTTWVECAKWGEQTGILPYLTKGTQVYVEGQPEVRTWEKDGKGGASLTVRVSNIQLIGGGKSEQQPQQSQPKAAHRQEPELIDDLPF
jgi:single-strand DNA-binding protein